LNKLIAVGLIGAGLIGAVVIAKGSTAAAVTAVVMTPEGKACARMAALCPTNTSDTTALQRCEDDMARARKVSGDANFERSAKCLDEATSCAAASGCLAGGVGVGAVGEALKGFGTALSH
jgi:hypothetical protein